VGKYVYVADLSGGLQIININDPPNSNPTGFYKAADADAYLDGWIRSDWTPTDGEPAEVAERISADLENSLDEAALQAMLDKLS
jgi:hypothetical protein